MPKKSKLEKYNEDTKRYYESIEITPAEYRATVAEAKKHHQHVFKITKGVTGIFFYECACGFHDASMEHE